MNTRPVCWPFCFPLYSSGWLYGMFMHGCQNWRVQWARTHTQKLVGVHPPWIVYHIKILITNARKTIMKISWTQEMFIFHHTEVSNSENKKKEISNKPYSKLELMIVQFWSLSKYLKKNATIQQWLI